MKAFPLGAPTFDAQPCVRGNRDRFIAGEVEQLARDVDGREFVAFWLDGESRVLAGMNVNIWDVLDDIKSLIRSKTVVDPDKLADPQAPLGELVS